MRSGAALTLAARRDAEGRFYAELGARLRAARLKRGIPYPELAVIAGVSPTHYTTYETGRHPIPLFTLLAVVPALGCTYADLLPAIAGGRSPLFSTEALELARAFDQIKDENIRRLLSDSILGAGRRGSK